MDFSYYYYLKIIFSTVKFCTFACPFSSAVPWTFFFDKYYHNAFKIMFVAQNKNNFYSCLDNDILSILLVYKYTQNLFGYITVYVGCVWVYIQYLKKN